MKCQIQHKNLIVAMKLTSLIVTAILTVGVFSFQTQAGTAENWDKHCAKCHGPDGKGDTKMGRKAGVKDMTTAEYQAELKEDHAAKAIKEGLKEKGQEKMKPNKTLSDEEIKALIAHIRSFKK